MLVFMQCPYCSYDTRVTNSRSHNNSHIVWRRRQCKNCQAIWTTRELYDLTSTHRVSNAVLTDFEPFSRDILFVSIFDSLRHRNDQLTVASALTDTVISKVLALNQADLSKKDISALSFETLNNFDNTAGAVYQAIHKH